MLMTWLAVGEAVLLLVVCRLWQLAARRFRFERVRLNEFLDVALSVERDLEYREQLLDAAEFGLEGVSEYLSDAQDKLDHGWLERVPVLLSYASDAADALASELMVTRSELAARR